MRYDSGRTCCRASPHIVLCRKDCPIPLHSRFHQSLATGAAFLAKRPCLIAKVIHELFYDLMAVISCDPRHPFWLTDLTVL